MHKEESYYNENGERVFNRVTRFTGRFSEEKGYSLYAHGKTTCSRIMDLPPSLSKVDIGNLFLLSRRLQSETNVLVYRTSKGKNPMDATRIGKVLQLQERQTRRFIKNMMDMGILAKRMARIGGDDVVEYVMNPLYFMNGKTIGDELYWTFQEQLDVHIPAWVRETYRKRKDEGI